MSKQSISIDQVQCGLYIELPLKWHEHPFLRGRFLLKDSKQLATLKGLGLKTLWYYPDKSQSEPLSDPPPSASLAVETEQIESSISQAWEVKQERLKKLQQRRSEINKVEKQYQEMVGQVKNSMYRMKNHPVQAMHESTALVGVLIDSMLSDEGAVLHLMGSGKLDEGLYYHALNVSVLAMLLGKSMNLPRPMLEVLGSGGLLHDIGKIKVPPQILRKTENLTKAEENFFQLHTKYGAELIRKYGELPPEVALIAEQHHEWLDGGGYPAGLKGKEIAVPARIVSIVNTYDNLCNHLNPELSLTPHESLALLFSKLGGHFDKTLLQHLVRLLGIYPPGTVVELSDGNVGMVISINSKELLWPSVLLYDEDIPKREAVIVDMAEDKTLTIVKSLRPRQLTEAVYTYLSPRERVSYFFKQLDKDTK